MANSTEFTQALHKWSETFMRRSIHDLIRFSKGSGLSMPQMSALFHLHHANMIDRLVQQGLIERTEDPKDRRVKQLKLTVKGKTIVQEGTEIRRRWIENLTNTLTNEQQEAITDALNILTNTAKEMEPSLNPVRNE